MKRLTLAQVARLTGMSKATVWRRVAKDQIAPYESGSDGVITITAADLPLIKSREPGKSGRGKAVMLRPQPERYAAWERAAKGSVSAWLGRLADAASGWEPK